MKPIGSKAAAFLYAGSLTLLPSPAALIPRGGGIVYHDVQGLSWLQDANDAKTTGAAPGGLMIWSTAAD